MEKIRQLIEKTINFYKKKIYTNYEESHNIVSVTVLDSHIPSTKNSVKSKSENDLHKLENHLHKPENDLHKSKNDNTSNLSYSSSSKSSFITLSIKLAKALFNVAISIFFEVA